MSKEITEGICGDGICFLENGVRLSVDEIKGRLQQLSRTQARLEEAEKELSKYPMQPLIKDEQSVIRFEKNPIIAHFCRGLNEISIWCQENEIDDKYYQQLTQLIGYSISGYGELSTTSDESYERAEKAAQAFLANQNTDCGIKPQEDKE